MTTSRASTRGEPSTRRRRARDQARRALDDVDPRVLTRPVTPFTSLSTTRVFERRRSAPSRVCPGIDAPLVGAVHGVEHGGGLQQGLGGDASTEQTGASEPVISLDQGDALTELGGAKGRGIAPGPGSDHDDVVGITHPGASLPGPRQPAVVECVRCRAMDEPVEPGLQAHPARGRTSSLGREDGALRRVADADRIRGCPGRASRPFANGSGLFDLTHLGQGRGRRSRSAGRCCSGRHERPGQGGRRRGAVQPRPQRGRRRDRGSHRLPHGGDAVLRRAERRQRAAGAADPGGDAGRRSAPPDVPPGLVLPGGPGPGGGARDAAGVPRGRGISRSCSARSPSTGDGRSSSRGRGTRARWGSSSSRTRTSPQSCGRADGSDGAVRRHAVRSGRPRRAAPGDGLSAVRPGPVRVRRRRWRPGSRWAVASTRGTSGGERRWLGSGSGACRAACSGLRMQERRRIPRAHYPVFVGDQLIGEVTIGTFSPLLGTGIGARLPLACRCGRGGDTVEVDIRGRRAGPRVVRPPFVDRRPALTAGRAQRSARPVRRSRELAEPTIRRSSCARISRASVVGAPGGSGITATTTYRPEAGMPILRTGPKPGAATK